MKKIFTKTNNMEHDETKRLKQILASSGKLASDLVNKKKGELVMSSLSSSR